MFTHTQTRTHTVQRLARSTWFGLDDNASIQYMWLEHNYYVIPTTNPSDNFVYAYVMCVCTCASN